MVVAAIVTVPAAMELIAPTTMIAMVEMSVPAPAESPVMPVMAPAFEAAPVEVVVVKVVPVEVTVIKISVVVGVPVATPIESVVPRPGSDEYAIHEPIRAVVAVGGTCIGVISVVAPSAYWRRSNFHDTWSNSYSNPYPYLRVRGSCREDHCSHQREVF